MIQISDTAQTHFRKLIEREGVPGMGVRLSAVDPGTPRADARLEFAEPTDLLAALAGSTVPRSTSSPALQVPSS